MLKKGGKVGFKLKDLKLENEVDPRMNHLKSAGWLSTHHSFM